MSAMQLILVLCAALISVSAADFTPLDRQFEAKLNPYFNEKAFDKANKLTIDYRPRGRNPQPPNSGDTVININDQIVGGSKASRGQFPWQVLLTLDGSYMCGGSLISADWVLTAAHCCHEITEFTVTVGIINKSGNEASKVVFVTKQKFVHKDYDPVYLKNDIALLKLPKTVDISGPFATPVRLPKISEARKNMANKIGIVSGWGKVGDDDTTSEVLKFVSKKVVDNKNCAKLYGNISISANSLCISNTDNKGTCNGDSGGPFVIQDADNKYTQIGLVSFGAAASCVKYPSGFTRVAGFLGWISDITSLQIRP